MLKETKTEEFDVEHEEEGSMTNRWMAGWMGIPTQQIIL